MHFLKKFLKVIMILLIISLISFTGYRYYKLKNEGKLESVFAKNENNSKDFSYDSQSAYTENSESNDSNKKEEKNSKDNKKESSDGGYVVEEKNYDGYYNEFNFDARLILYEGKQHNGGTKEAFNILIADASDPLYSKPTIIFENFDGLSTNVINADNLDEYKSVLEVAKNSLGGSGCTFTFGYNKLKTIVNKVTITKN
ncbi:MAG: hypothetical protein IKL55_05305 [Clostridia bacterium]|nr:hypothetical protein [Clostridia bacterium]